MAYCRYNEDSDVYVLKTIDDIYQCHCELGVAFSSPDIRELRSHLIDHLLRGDKVPHRVFLRIQRELEDIEWELSKTRD